MPPPMLQPPDSPVPPVNDRGVTIVVVCCIFLVLAALAVAGRLWARRYKRTPLAADDYLAIAALFLVYGNGLSEMIGVFIAGRGHHFSELSVPQIAIALQTLLSAEICWTLGTSATKISLLLLYMRIFPSRRFRYLAYVFCALVSIYCIGCFIYFFANCRPFAATFDITIPNACGDQRAGWLGTGLANIVTDVAILCLPMKHVWELQLPSKTRAALAAVFGIGFITLIVSIVRLVTLMQIDVTDFTYTANPADITSLVEPCLMIICACLPVMRSLFQKYLPSLFGRGGESANRRIRGAHYDYEMKSDSHGSSHTTSNTGNKIPKRVSIAPSGEGFKRLRDQEDGHAIELGRIQEQNRGNVGMAAPLPNAPAKGNNGGIEVTREFRIDSE